MCGIFCSARFQDPNNIKDDSAFNSLGDKLRNANALRGPDSQKEHCVDLDRLPESTRGLTIQFYASELRLRGDDYSIDQPHTRLDGDILCWNGEIFEGVEVDLNENDGVRLFETTSACRSTSELRDLFATIEGPYAFVFYLKSTKQLIYGRDPLGRRSLLVHKPSHIHPYLMLSSVASRSPEMETFEDLSTEHIYCLDVDGLSRCGDMSRFEDFVTPLDRSPSMPSNNSFAVPAQVNPIIPPDNPPCISSLDSIPEYLSDAVSGLISHLDKSVMLRVQNIPKKSMPANEARVAILFSGGIDSTVIAFLAHRHLPLDEPIDLLNVAFDNPRALLEPPRRQKKKQPTLQRAATPPKYLVPDRQTGLEELEELRQLCPGRRWNFVEVNVPYDVATSARGTVESLMFPNRTVMDLSLALALYFASRGIGQIRKHKEAEPVPYTSPARVLLNGLGSDELLGGYGRHRTAYTAGGWDAVVKELQLEIDRIPLRNLGRDDRVISSHGKEMRHPFLSMSLLRFLAGLPIQQKVDPRLEIGLGDKMLLRLAARKLGLVEASSRKKRAMQFGSRSARMDDNAKGDVVI